jgi:hypothetical protein
LRPINYDLRTEFEEDELRWVDRREVVDRLSYDNLKEYFKSVQEELV